MTSTASSWRSSARSQTRASTPKSGAASSPRSWATSTGTRSSASSRRSSRAWAPQRLLRNRLYTDAVLRLAAVLGLVAVLVLCSLLFGIGLDDLTNERTEPRVIFSVVVLPIFIGAASFGIVRLVRRRAGRPDGQSRRLG